MIRKSIGFSKGQISPKNQDEQEELYIETNPTEEEVEEQIAVMEKVEEAMDEAEKRATTKIIHKGFAKDSPVQLYVQYAYEIGGMDLVLLMECENGNWNMYQQSTVVKNGKREDSWGLCQIHRPDHTEIVNNPLFRSDYKRQIDRCKELMNGGTLFFGRDRKIGKKQIKCSEYVKDRFILEQNNNG